MFAVCGVPKKEFKTVCSSIDKLDKLPWEDVRNELCNEKHIHCDVINKLETFLRLRGLLLYLFRKFQVAFIKHRKKEA